MKYLREQNSVTDDTNNKQLDNEDTQQSDFSS